MMGRKAAGGMEVRGEMVVEGRERGQEAMCAVDLISSLPSICPTVPSLDRAVK